MEKIAISILSLWALTFCLCACDPANYYDVNLGEVVVTPEDNVIPQKGGIITIPADWVIATKFQFPVYHQPVKYRAFIGSELLCGQTAAYLPKNEIIIPIPKNDTYEALDIKVQIAFGDGYIPAEPCGIQDNESISFGEWQDKFIGRQAALPKDSPKEYGQIDNAGLVLSVGGQQFNIITYDSWAVKCLKRRVAECPFEYSGHICTDSRIEFVTDDLISCIPAVSQDFRNGGYTSGRIYFDNYLKGEIVLFKNDVSLASNTLLGDISPDDIERWQGIFKDASLDPDYFNETIKLNLAY